eukprot:s339_g18.t1
MEMVQSDVSPSSQMSQVRRFIERDETSRQSTGRINILRVHNAQHSGWSSFWADPFHSVIHHSTIKIIAFFCASYLFTHLVFSLIYYMIDASCQLQCPGFITQGSRCCFSSNTEVPVAASSCWCDWA